MNKHTVAIEKYRFLKLSQEAILQESRIKNLANVFLAVETVDEVEVAWGPDRINLTQWLGIPEATSNLKQGSIVKKNTLIWFHPEKPGTCTQIKKFIIRWVYAPTRILN